MSAGSDQLPSRARAKNPKLLKIYQEITAKGAYNLNSTEEWWRDRYHIFEKHGYRLRPRYHPDWKPSWIGTNIIPHYCEDSYIQQIKPICDAVRIVDGAAVIIKRVHADGGELHVGKYFSSPELRRDEDNHCVPILDDFHDDAEPERDFMVMPLLRKFNDPPFLCVKEVVDFMDQTLRGLVFLHEHGVAHRDCSNGNVMMDGSTLYPNGFHPVQHNRSPSGAKEAIPLRRTDVSSVKYYFVDFGLSSRFLTNEPREVWGRNGLDQEVPELNKDDSDPYDPFFVDVFILGNLYKKTFVNVYHNMNFMKPLTDAMTQFDPKERPSAKEALEKFRSIVALRSELSLRWRLRSKSEFILASLYRDIDCSIQEAMRLGNSFSFKFGS